MAPKTIVPMDSNELEEMLADEKVFKDHVQNPADLGRFIMGYVDASKRNDPGITEQARDQVQLILKDWLAENETKFLRSSTPIAPGHKSGKGADYNENAPGAGVEDIMSKREFLSAIHPQARNSRNASDLGAKLDKLKTIQNSYGTIIPDAGGFLVPESFRSEIMAIALESAVVRPRATVIPMENARVHLPAIDVTSNVSSVFGGIVCYWAEEAAPLTESQAQFQSIMLDTKKLTAFASVPSELPQDASAFNGFLDQRLPEALANFEDRAFCAGSGAGEPLGWLANPATVTTTAEAGQGTGSIVWQNVVKMFARMLPTSLSKAVWVVSPDVFPELATMALSVGTGGSAVWLNNGVEGPPATILGRPVIISEKMNTLGTAGDINFVDLSYYLVGDRQTMLASASEHFQFNQDKIAYRWIQRLDGRPWLQSAITPQNNGNTLSAFVNLSSTRT
jgi:HK97 family phage major capsid protein